jgi:hypothetical protein
VLSTLLYITHATFVADLSRLTTRRRIVILALVFSLGFAHHSPADIQTVAQRITCVIVTTSFPSITACASTPTIAAMWKPVCTDRVAQAQGVEQRRRQQPQVALW